jgi:ABC-type multidrug transport system ATPase subunit
MLTRESLMRLVEHALRLSPVVVLIGPRQAGKTTLARTLLPETSPTSFDLEGPLRPHRVARSRHRRRCSTVVRNDEAALRTGARREQERDASEDCINERRCLTDEQNQHAEGGALKI